MINNPMAYVDGKIVISDPDVEAADFKAFISFLCENNITITRENIVIMLHLGK